MLCWAHWQSQICRDDGQLLSKGYIWHSVRMSLGICPGASPKFWRSVGSIFFFFENTMRKLRSIAFQPCISWGGKYFWNGSNKWFRPNFRPENTNFGGHFSWSPDFGGLWDLKTWNFVSFDIIPKKYWLKRDKWAMSSYGRVKNVRFDVIILFFCGRTPKNAKKCIFLYFPQLLNILMS